MRPVIVAEDATRAGRKAAGDAKFAMRAGLHLAHALPGAREHQDEFAAALVKHAQGLKVGDGKMAEGTPWARSPTRARLAAMAEFTRGRADKPAPP